MRNHDIGSSIELSQLTTSDVIRVSVEGSDRDSMGGCPNPDALPTQAPLSRKSLKCLGGKIAMSEEGRRVGPNVIKLLELMLTKPGLAIKRIEGIMCVWPDGSWETCGHNLDSHMNQLRRFLDANGTHPSGFVVREFGMFRLDPGESLTIDVDIFRKLVQKGRRLKSDGDENGAIQAMKDATSAYTGDFLPNGETSEIKACRDGLRADYIGCLREVSDFYLKRGLVLKAANWCSRLKHALGEHEMAMRRAGIEFVQLAVRDWEVWLGSSDGMLLTCPN